MTPKGTLDGNYIVVFQKRAYTESPQFNGTVEDAKRLAIDCAERIIAASYLTSPKLQMKVCRVLTMALAIKI